MDGIINVYKEAGYTSFDVVAKLRGILKQKKIGHTGTLDPDAKGVLPVCIGKATKLCEYLTGKDKIYQAVLHLGITTDTQDLSGRVLKEQTPDVSEETICLILDRFIGRQKQVPPMYSALKVNGKKLCDLARQGVEVERKAREIEIFSIEILSVKFPRVTLQVHCSKGTYIRTLCQDIGEMAGCGGCLEKLVRIKSGRFSIQDSYKLAEIETAVLGKAPLGRQIHDILLPVDAVLEEYPKISAVSGTEKILYNGGRLSVSKIKQNKESLSGLYRMYDTEGLFIGLFRYEENLRELVPAKMFL